MARRDEAGNNTYNENNFDGDDDPSRPSKQSVTEEPGERKLNWQTLAQAINLRWKGNLHQTENFRGGRASRPAPVAVESE